MNFLFCQLQRIIVGEKAPSLGHFQVLFKSVIFHIYLFDKFLLGIIRHLHYLNHNRHVSLTVYANFVCG